MRDDEVMSGGHGVSTDDEKWTRRDVWLGLLFLLKGALLAALTYSFHQNGLPMVLYIPSALLGTVFLLLGLNAVVRSLASGR
jgi:hypothetical protein